MGTEEHEKHAENLNSVRKNLPKSPAQAVKKVKKIFSIWKYFNPYLDWLYGIALAAALLKDILDLVVIGSLPGIGTVITLMATITIWAVMIITGSAFRAKKFKNIIKRYLTLVLGTLVELIFGIDFLPIETIMVIYVTYNVFKDRQESAETQNK